MKKSKKHNWKDLTVTIGGKEIKGIKPITFDNEIDQPEENNTYSLTRNYQRRIFRPKRRNA